jgi:hypothetical protein
MSERVFKNEIVTDNPFDVGFPSKELGNVERATTTDDCLVLLPFEGELMRFKYDQVTINGSTFGNVYLLLKALKNIGYAQYYNVSNGSSGGSAATSVEEIYYIVTTAFTGSNINDVLLNRQVVSLSDGAIQSETWINLTTGLELSSTPTASKITAQSATPLTNAQLTTQGLAKDDTAQKILTAIKAQGGSESVIDSAATPVIWNMVLDTASTPPAVVYYQYGTTTVGTPTFPVKPYEYVAGSVSVSSSALPVGAAEQATMIQIKNLLVDISSKLNQLKSHVEQFTATAGQTVFTLANTPIGDVAISINGTRIPKNAITVTDKQVTYIPTNNLDYVLEAGDIVILDY